MQGKIEEMAKRFDELERLLSTPQVASNPALAKTYAKERVSLVKPVQVYRELEEVRGKLAQARAVAAEAAADPEMKEMAEAEVRELTGREQSVRERLEEVLLTEDGSAGRDMIMEIRAGTGGEEAALFASDLFRMYQYYAQKRGWKVELIEADPSEQGGFREVILSIKGEDAYRKLRYESGGHRVQRVPATETQGRIHTSAATVAVMPEAEEVEFAIRTEDLRIDTYRAGGKGGQHVNKTASAVRITHVPTGVVVAIQDERSQHKNREKAMRVLRSRLLDLHESKKKREQDAARRSLIGSGDRNDRVRTYNFPQNRLTDHRIGVTLYQLDRIMEGELEPMVQAVLEYDKKLRLGQPVEKGKSSDD